MSADIVSQTNMHSTEIEEWWIGGPFHSTNQLGCAGVENPYYQLNESGQSLFGFEESADNARSGPSEGVYLIIQLS